MNRDVRVANVVPVENGLKFSLHIDGLCSLHGLVLRRSLESGKYWNIDGLDAQARGWEERDKARLAGEVVHALRHYYGVPDATMRTLSRGAR